MKKNSLLKKLVIDTKKPIYEIQIGEKKYILNGKTMEAAIIKAAREDFGGIGVLMRARQMKVVESQIKKSGVWHYISSKHIFKRKLKESNFPDF